MDMKLRQTAGLIFIVLIIGMMMYLVRTTSEGFIDSMRCGVDLPSCQGENVRCMNGYCKSDIPPKLPPFSDLPITPPKLGV